jgi:uncharacterized protein (DUF1778 family)
MKTGRPLRAEAPAEPLQVRLSPAEKRTAAVAASVNQQTVSAFCRDAIVTAAADCLEDTQEERMQRVKILIEQMGNPARHPGDIVYMEEEQAKAWVAKGYAALVSLEEAVKEKK